MAPFSSPFSCLFIWRPHLFLSNRTQHKPDRTQYLSPSCPLRMAGNYSATIWGRGFCQILHNKNNHRTSQVTSVVNLICAEATESKLFLNSFPRCQNSTIYTAFRWATPSTYISSLNEILGNHKTKETIEQLVRKLGCGARLPGCSLDPKIS